MQVAFALSSVSKDWLHCVPRQMHGVIALVAWLPSYSCMRKSLVTNSIQYRWRGARAQDWARIPAHTRARPPVCRWLPDIFQRQAGPTGAGLRRLRVIGRRRCPGMSSLNGITDPAGTCNNQKNLLPHEFSFVPPLLFTFYRFFPFQTQPPAFHRETRLGIIISIISAKSSS
jgi:hypothetical protein